MGTNGSTIRLTPEEKAGMKNLWVVYGEHYHQIQERLAGSAASQPEFACFLQLVPPEWLAEQNEAYRQLILRAMVDDEWEPYLVSLRAQGTRYAESAISLESWFGLLGEFRAALMPLLSEAYGKTQHKLLLTIQAMDRFIDLAMPTMGTAYLQTKEKIISEQQEAVRELSTPVLQVRDRLLLMPIIGVIDAQRAAQLTDQLLQAIRTYRARVLVLDVTGVPLVDSFVANHLVQTIEAAGLLGAGVIVTGISTAVSQMLVRLGIDLSKLRAIGDLQSGIEEAERLLSCNSASLG
jgi:rsbT co-antagonist protein RsbR